MQNICVSYFMHKLYRLEDVNLIKYSTFKLKISGSDGEVLD